MKQMADRVTLIEGINVVKTVYLLLSRNLQWWFPTGYLLTINRSQNCLRNKDYKISANVQDKIPSHSNQALDDVKIICYGSRFCVTNTLIFQLMYWYHLYLNQMGCGRISNKIRKVCGKKSLLYKQSYLLI